MTNENMEYLGEFYGYQLFRNSEGFIEGAKSIGLQNVQGYCRPAKELKRVVTNVTEIEDFKQFVPQSKKKTPAYNPHKDDKQTKLDVI